MTTDPKQLPEHIWIDTKVARNCGTYYLQPPILNEPAFASYSPSEPSASGCRWTLMEDLKDGRPSLYRSDCGIMLTRRQGWWKYCQLCGKEIE